MKIVKLIHIILFVFIPYFLSSQEDILTPKFSINSQYQYVSFMNGVVEFNDGSTLNAELNYNVVREEMHFIDRDTIKILTNQDINSVYLNNTKYVLYNSKYYIELFNDKNYKLLYFKKPDFSDINKIEGAYNISRDNSTSRKVGQIELQSGTGSKLVDIKEDNSKEIKVIDQYYILNSDNELILPTKKNICKLSNKGKEEIYKFIKENNLKTNKKEDLIEILSFI